MSDEYETDEWLMDLFEGWYDPCPLKQYSTKIGDQLNLPREYNENGLKVLWNARGRKVFVNPPYSNPLPWVKAAIEEKRLSPEMVIVMLLKHDSSTEWYRLLHEAGAHFLMVNGRLKHRTGTGAAFPSVVVIL